MPPPRGRPLHALSPILACAPLPMLTDVGEMLNSIKLGGLESDWAKELCATPNVRIRIDDNDATTQYDSLFILTSILISQVRLVHKRGVEASGVTGMYLVTYKVTVRRSPTFYLVARRCHTLRICSLAAVPKKPPTRAQTHIKPDTEKEVRSEPYMRRRQTYVLNCI